jgi:hypothetical protein
MQYPVIAQPQYGFAPTMPMNFKEGGIASLPDMAEKVQSAGRNGDTMLAHITPEEAGILQLLGGSGTINPKTGVPEFFKLSSLNPVRIVKKAGKELERGIESIADKLGPVGQIAAAYFGGPIGAALYAGLAPKGSSFDVKRAALAGGLTYGATGTLNPSFNYSGAFGGAPNAAGTGGPYDISDVGSMGDLGMADVGTTPYGTLSPPPTVASLPPAPPLPGTAPGGAPIVQASPGMPGAGAAAPAPTTASGVGSLAEAAGETALNYGSRAVDYAMKNPATTAFAGTQIYAAAEAKKELDAQKAEADRIMADQENRTREEIAFAQDVLARYPVEYRRLTGEDIESLGMAAGGLAGLNAFKAGGQPRFLKGGGDGMSDDIPATIGGRQKAALSDGEFVIPADVVSHLGNGSSRAGAKKLYSMMDNIRKARTGKERQAPEVKADRYMPA